MIATFALWWRRNVVALDPDPRYSYLDRLDGRTQHDES